MARRAQLVLVVALSPGLLAGCSHHAGSPGPSSEATVAAAVRSPVALRPAPGWLRSACGGFRTLRVFCPAAFPAGRRGLALSMAVATPRYPLDLLQLEAGGEFFGRQRLNRPPRYVGWFLASGPLGRLLRPIFPAPGQRAAPVRDGQADAPRRHALSFGRRSWGRISGQLFLAPTNGRVPLVYFRYLVFAWRQGGTEMAIGLHAWEPFTETARTLQAMVDRFRAVPPAPLAHRPLPHAGPVPMTIAPDWLTGACRALRTRPICPRRVPVGPTTYVTLFFEPHWRSSTHGASDLLSVEWGAPHPRPGENRPPAFAHLELMAGDISLRRRFPGGQMRPRDGLMRGREGEAGGPTVLLGSPGWRGTKNVLVLGDCFANHLCYRWRDGDRTFQVDLHGWEPFRETVATLRGVVDSIP